MEFVIIYSTTPDKDEAKQIAKTLIEDKLASCVSMVDKIHSVFSWHDKICEETEVLLIIKTRRENFEKVEKIIKHINSYNIPEILAVPVIEGSADYLSWIEAETV